MADWISSGRRPPGHSGSHSNREHQPSTSVAQIVAYEAQLVYDQSDLASQIASSSSTGNGQQTGSSRGAGLLKWQGECPAEVTSSEYSGTLTGDGIWIDRHHVLHLLASLPPVYDSKPEPSDVPVPPSPSSSWDSLPSDQEETFDLSDEEDYAEYQRERKRRWMEIVREERIKERAQEDQALKSADVAKKESYVWKDDEEPPPATQTLMAHTAVSLSKSPNPHQLEMRILANHASDDRFSFLQGRYKHAWDKVKSEIRLKNQNDPAKKAKEEKAIGALVGGYESSDNEESNGNDVKPEPPAAPPTPPPPPPPEEPIPVLPPLGPPAASDIHDNAALPVQTSISPTNEIGTVPNIQNDRPADDEEEKKRLRKLKLEEWKRKRADGASEVMHDR